MWLLTCLSYENYFVTVMNHNQMENLDSYLLTVKFISEISNNHKKKAIMIYRPSTQIWLKEKRKNNRKIPPPPHTHTESNFEEITIFLMSVLC